MSNTTCMKWIEELKKNDKVVVYRYGRAERIVTVIRFTQRWVITDGERRWRKKDGYEVGRDGWDMRRIRPVTDEDLAVESHRTLFRDVANRLRFIGYQDVSRKALREFADAIGLTRSA